MSKYRTRQRRTSKQYRPLRQHKSRTTIVILGLLLSLSFAGGILAQWRRLHASTPGTALLATVVVPQPQATPSLTLAKEYIYVGGRLIATEEPTPTATPSSSPVTCPPLAPNSIVISEFRLRGINGPLDEFIELANMSDTPLTVCTEDGSSGWAVASSDGIIRLIVPTGTVIPARGHYLGANQGNSGTTYNASGYSLSHYATFDGKFLLTPGLRIPLEISSSTSTSPVTAATIATPTPPDELPTPTPPPELNQDPQNSTSDIPDNTGLALFKTANPANCTLVTRLDAVGFSSTSNPLFREGDGLPPIVTVNDEHSLVRKLTSGYPQDTNNNAADFLFISITGGSYGGTVASVLGAPGPENLSSPVQRNNAVRASLIDPSQGSSSPSNRARNSTPNQAVCTGYGGCPLGTLSIRRSYMNLTGANISRLRFRVTDVTTLHSPGYVACPDPNNCAQADVRFITSPDIIVTRADGSTVTARGTVIDQPPAQYYGGGVNATLTVGGITMDTPLRSGESVGVQFLLAIHQMGSFRFLVNVEPWH